MDGALPKVIDWSKYTGVIVLRHQQSCIAEGQRAHVLCNKEVRSHRRNLTQSMLGYGICRVSVVLESFSACYLRSSDQWATTKQRVPPADVHGLKREADPRRMPSDCPHHSIINPLLAKQDRKGNDVRRIRCLRGPHTHECKIPQGRRVLRCADDPAS